MNERQIRKLLRQFRGGAIDENQVVARLTSLPYEDLGFAKIDHHRELWQSSGDQDFLFEGGEQDHVPLAQRRVDFVRDMLRIMPRQDLALVAEDALPTAQASDANTGLCLSAFRATNSQKFVLLRKFQRPTGAS